MRREKTAPRGPLPPEVLKAVIVIHHNVWHDYYRPGKGPMHHARGPYWGNRLRSLAGKWERMAAAARVCAEFLPGEEEE